MLIAVTVHAIGAVTVLVDAVAHAVNSARVLRGDVVVAVAVNDGAVADGNCPGDQCAVIPGFLVAREQGPGAIGGLAVEVCVDGKVDRGFAVLTAAFTVLDGELCACGALEPKDDIGPVRVRKRHLAADRRDNGGRRCVKADRRARDRRVGDPKLLIVGSGYTVFVGHALAVPREAVTVLVYAVNAVAVLVHQIAKSVRGAREGVRVRVVAVIAAFRGRDKAIAVHVDAVDAVTVLVHVITERVRVPREACDIVIVAVVSTGGLARVAVAVRVDAVCAVAVLVDIVTDRVCGARVAIRIRVITVGAAAGSGVRKEGVMIEIAVVHYDLEAVLSVEAQGVGRDHFEDNGAVRQR